MFLAPVHSSSQFQHFPAAPPAGKSRFLPRLSPALCVTAGCSCCGQRAGLARDRALPPRFPSPAMLSRTPGAPPRPRPAPPRPCPSPRAASVCPGHRHRPQVGRPLPLPGHPFSADPFPSRGHRARGRGAGLAPSAAPAPAPASTSSSSAVSPPCPVGDTGQGWPGRGRESNWATAGFS